MTDVELDRTCTRIARLHSYNFRIKLVRWNSTTRMLRLNSSEV